MSENKSYAMLVDSEETIKHTIIFAIFSFLFFIIFFNNVPETSLEIAIDKILIKNIGYYSHTYPFQSQIISNEVLWLTPPLSLYVSLKSKIIHLSIEELKQKNLYICTSIYRKLTRVIFFLIFSFLSFLIYIYFFYFHLEDLADYERNTLLVRDNAIGLLLMQSLFFCFYHCTFSFIMARIIHPIVFLNLEVYSSLKYSETYRKGRIHSKLDKYYKEQRNNKNKE